MEDGTWKREATKESPPVFAVWLEQLQAGGALVWGIPGIYSLWPIASAARLKQLVVFLIVGTSMAQPSTSSAPAAPLTTLEDSLKQAGATDLQLSTLGVRVLSDLCYLSEQDLLRSGATLIVSRKLLRLNCARGDAVHLEQLPTGGM